MMVESCDLLIIELKPLSNGVGVEPTITQTNELCKSDSMGPLMRN